MWEVFTYGSLPFNGFSTKEVEKFSEQVRDCEKLTTEVIHVFSGHSRRMF